MKIFLTVVSGTVLGGLILLLGLAFFSGDFFGISTLEQEKPDNLVNDPKDVTVIRHAASEDINYLTVLGVIENSGRNRYFSPDITVKVMSGGRPLTTCNSVPFGTLEPNARRPFLIECPATPYPLPPGASYSVRVQSVRPVFAAG